MARRMNDTRGLAMAFNTNAFTMDRVTTSCFFPYFFDLLKQNSP